MENEEGIKISCPLMTDQELEELEMLLENDYEIICKKISKVAAKDKDIIILKKVIEHQQKRIEELEQINEEHRKLNGKLREEINKLKKEKEDILDYMEE